MTTITDKPTGTNADEFPKPGPGTWTLDSGHFGPDCSKICQDLITAGCTEGTAEGFEMVGAPLKELQASFVKGRFYTRMAPLVGSSKDLPTPPNAALWLATRLHPAFRKAEKKAGNAIDGRMWLAEHKRWNEEWKPQLIAECTRLAGVDVSSMSDTELADHVAELYELCLFGARLHFRLHISDLGPIGLLLVRSRDWGLDPAKAMGALSGHSPATNAPSEALAGIRALVATQPQKPTSLDEVRNISPEVSGMLDDFLDEFGWRLTTGYDLRALTLREMPDAVLAAVTTQPSDLAAAESRDRAKDAGEAALASLRTQVAPGDVAELETLVDDARMLYGLRDENGPLTYQWPVGLLRRAVLETSRRLSSTDKLPADTTEPNDAVFDLSAAEMGALLRGAATPTVAEIAERVALRKHAMTLTAPTMLGPEEADPPLWTMPPNLGRLLDVVLTVMSFIEHEPSPMGTLEGQGIGSETYTGRARVVHEADEAIAAMEPGDVLVAPYTVPTYNAVLSIAGAIVSDAGGLLCHAAVIAREYGIPAVVGATAATSQIPDGALIEVNPSTGAVTIIELPT